MDPSYLDHLWTSPTPEPLYPFALSSNASLRGGGAYRTALASATNSGADSDTESDVKIAVADWTSECLWHLLPDPDSARTLAGILARILARNSGAKSGDRSWRKSWRIFWRKFWRGSWRQDRSGVSGARVTLASPPRSRFCPDSGENSGADPGADSGANSGARFGRKFWRGLGRKFGRKFRCPNRSGVSGGRVTLASPPRSRFCPDSGENSGAPESLWCFGRQSDSGVSAPNQILP